MLHLPDVAVPSDELSVSLRPVVRPELAAAWQALECRAAPSFFQSWGWIGCWLDSLPAALEPEVIEVRWRDAVVGLGVVVRRTMARRGILRSRILFLNATGDAERDAIYIEHNGLLCDQQITSAVEQRAIDWLVERDERWDELTLPGMPARWGALAAARGLNVWWQQVQPAYELDLGAVRQHADGLRGRLSRNTRQQLRRAERVLGAPARLRQAETVEEAQAFFSALKALHVASWERRGRRHAFSGAFFEPFHRALIAARFEAGEIQLLEAGAGGRPFGYLYNFVHRGRVYAYQSGFAQGDDPRAKPGLVSHALAVERNAAAGHGVYDMLAGDNQLKRSLADRSSEMLWLTLQRDRLPLRLERSLRGLKRRLAGQRSPGRGR